MCSHTQCEHEEANPWIDSCFSGGSGEEGVWKVLVFFSTLPQLFFLYSMQWSQDQGLWGLNQFLSKKLQLCIFNLYVRIPKGPMGQDGPSPLLVKLGLTVNTQLAVKIAHQFCTWVTSPYLTRTALRGRDLLD